MLCKFSAAAVNLDLQNKTNIIKKTKFFIDVFIQTVHNRS